MHNQPHTEETKKRLRDAANAQWSIWRQDDGSMLSLHSDMTSEGTRRAYSNNPDAWKKSAEFRRKHSELTRGKSYPNRGHKLSEFPDDWKQSLMVASHKSNKPGGAKISRYDAWFIKYVLADSGMNLGLGTIGMMFGLSPKSVSYILSGRTWRWVMKDDYKVS